MNVELLNIEQTYNQIATLYSKLKAECRTYEAAKKSDLLTAPLTPAVIAVQILSESATVLRIDSVSSDRDAKGLMLPLLLAYSGTNALKLIAMIPERGCEISSQTREFLEGRCFAHVGIPVSTVTSPVFYVCVLNETSAQLYKEMIA